MASELDMAFYSPTSLAFTGKRTRIQIQVNPVNELIKMRGCMPKEEFRKFRGHYGDILDLLDIKVLEEPLLALSQYWDNQLRAFVLPNFILSLVPEEYAGLLREPLTQESKFYKVPASFPTHQEVAELLNLPLKDVPFRQPGNVETLSAKFLIDHMEVTRRKGDWKIFSRTLALAVYGLVIFPTNLNVIDLPSISIFLAVERHRVNLVPAILAETMGSLVQCLGGKGKKLQCCLQLLTVWMANHLFGKGLSSGSAIDIIHHPLRDFSYREGLPLYDPKLFNPKDLEAWISFLGCTKERDVRWKLAWWLNDEILYSCGDYPNVPLVGPRTAVNYNPSLAHSQLTYRQRIPAEELIRPLFCQFKGTNLSRGRNLSEAWCKMWFKGKAELGGRGIEPTVAYQAWLKGRIDQKIVEEFVPLDPLLSNDLSKVENALKRKIGEHKAVLDNLEIRRARKVKAIREAESEYVMVKRDSEDARKNSPFLLEVQDLKVKNNQLEVKMMKEKETCQSRINAALIVSRREVEVRETRIQELETRIAELEHLNHNLQLGRIADEREIRSQLNGALLKIEVMTLQMCKLQKICDARAQVIEDLEKEVGQWKFEAEKVHDKIELMARFINISVPSFVEAFKKAEWQVHLPYIPSELEELLVFGRFLIDRWEAMLKI